MSMCVLFITSVFVFSFFKSLSWTFLFQMLLIMIPLADDLQITLCMSTFHCSFISFYCIPCTIFYIAIFHYSQLLRFFFSFSISYFPYNSTYPSLIWSLMFFFFVYFSFDNVISDVINFKVEFGHVFIDAVTELYEIRCFQKWLRESKGNLSYFSRTNSCIP